MTRKQTVAVLIAAAIALGGAGVAWAQTGEGDRAARREVVRTCIQQAREANPAADKEVIRDAVKSCLAELGFAPRLTEEQKAQARACLQEAKAANQDAGRRAVRAAARPCLEQAGILPPLTPEQEARRATVRACIDRARADHPGDRQAIRQAVKECVRSS